MPGQAGSLALRNAHPSVLATVAEHAQEHHAKGRLEPVKSPKARRRRVSGAFSTPWEPRPWAVHTHPGEPVHLAVRNVCRPAQIRWRRLEMGIAVIRNHFPEGPGNRSSRFEECPVWKRLASGKEVTLGHLAFEQTRLTVLRAWFASWVEMPSAGTLQNRSRTTTFPGGGWQGRIQPSFYLNTDSSRSASENSKSKSSDFGKRRWLGASVSAKK